MAGLDTLRDIVLSIIADEFRYHVPRLGQIRSVTDPNGKGRVRVVIPSLGWDTIEKAPWCFPTDKRALVTPAVDSWVRVEFMDGNRDKPFYSGIDPQVAGQLPESYTSADSQIIFEGGAGALKIAYGERADVLEIGKSAFKEAARKDDAITSSSATDPTFWTWITAVSGATGVAPPPTSLTGKISGGSSQVQIGDK